MFFVIAIEIVRYCTKMSTKKSETSEIAKLIVHSIYTRLESYCVPQIIVDYVIQKGMSISLDIVSHKYVRR